jgi:hypothetical protein
MSVRSGAEEHDAWMPIAGGMRQLEVEVLRVEQALTRGWPALARALGPAEVEGLAREFVLSHPFFLGSKANLGELLRMFLAVALEADACRGAWLSELAQLEEALASVRDAGRDDGDDDLAGGRLLHLEHRVDELRLELLAGGPWGAPRPAEVLLAVLGGSTGARCVELDLSSEEDALLRAALAPPRSRRADAPNPSAA